MEPLSFGREEINRNTSSTMSPLSSAISNHIRFLLQSSNYSNLASVVSELCQFADYGSDGCILLFQACLDQVNFGVRDMHNMQWKPDLLSAIFRYLLDKPNFSTVMCEALRSALLSETYLDDLSNTLHLSLSEKICIGLALSDAENPDFRKKGQSFCIARIEELCSNPSSVVSHDRIYDIVMFLSRSEGLAKHLDSFTNMLFLLQLKEKRSFILDPMFTDDLCEVKSLRHLDFFSECIENDFDAVLVEVEKEMSMADIMAELGYGCTVDASHCKEMLSLFLPLNEVTLSRVLSTIARTHGGLDDSQNIYSTFISTLGYNSTADFSWPSSWNVDVLVDSINQLVPETNWTYVMENLDHDGFYFPDENAFSLFMSIYANACQDPFPLHAICGSVWKNAEGQLSFLRYAVSAPPEIFTFAHSARKLPYVDALPGNEVQHGNVNQAWFCLDLLEVLCQLAERGHASSIRTMFQVPLKHCPEALLMGIAHINTAYNLLQYEVSSIVFPMIVGSALRSCTIHNIWHVNPSLVLRGFVDVHNIDPDNISRILDICQNLKILSPVLDMTPFSFSIKLAALASQKDYLDLDKWLDKNLSTYQDDFFEGCLKFLKELPFDAADGLHSNRFQQSADVISVRPETSSAFFKVLRAHSGKLISHQLSEDMKRLHMAFMQANSRLQSGGSTDLSTLNGYPDDIEAEANSFFNHMFLENLTIDAMVQMLARFKGNSENREKMIFDCMIGNLFEEYKFFPRYPEKHLKITAVFLGSLVKLQLVTDRALSIAQCAVLDALRKSVDSKMFMFGVTALEQFVERLVEWPQYGHHIVQISHLRGSHAELVAIIEQALSCTSSSQLESNGNIGAPIDQHQSSTQTLVNNMEVEGSSFTQPGQKISSPLHIMDQRFLDEMNKASVVSVSYMKPPLSPAGQPSPVSTASVSSSLQTLSTQHPTNAKTVMLSSPGFIRPQGIMSGGMLRQHSHNTGFGAALKIDTLVAASERKDTPIEVPSLEVQDKILFMINNISTANMDTKAAEFIEVLKEQYYPWFAQFMVMKRASIEPNFHDLYLKFLDKINSRSLNSEIVKATYENCKVLLRSELIKSSSEERSLLKNLGSWLGKFTIGRNQVLRARDIDPKKIIIEAYEKGLMIAVIPFTSKILEPCQWSRAYCPPNPWTMAILHLLVEIYALPNLKMNLKFDIEVLFKNLGVDMKDVRPTSLLKDRVREVEGNPDFSNKDFSSFSVQPVVDLNTGVLSSLNQVEFQPEDANPSDRGGHSDVLTQLASSLLGEDDKMGTLSLSERLHSGQGLSQPTLSQSPFLVSQPRTSISNFGAHAVINPELNSLGLQLHFQRIFEIAFDRAVKQVLYPVVQHSITIASQTTRELILKDYVMESDESRIYNAAHSMVETLAGSLALVTCKENLRVVMSSQLRTLLQTLNVPTELLEQVVQLFIKDNLNPMCEIIVQAATNKALQNIDGEIAPTLAFRRKQREGVGSAFYDASTYSQGPFARVPEALRPKPGRLSIAQQRVYEDFVRFPWQNQLSQSSNTMPADPPESIAVTHPLDLISEAIDTTSAQLLSAPSSHIGIGDGTIQHTADINSAGFASTAASPELPLMKPSSESETVIQLSPTTSVRESLDRGILEPIFSTGNALDKYQIVAQKLKTLVNNDARDAEIQGVVSEVPDIILRCVSRDEAALVMAQKVFKSLYENASNHKHIRCHLAVLASIRDVCKHVTQELTSWVIYSDEGMKLNINIAVGLIRSGLLNLVEYTTHLSKLIDGGRNKAATEFSITLLKKLVAHEPGVSLSEFYNLIDSLGKLAMRPRSPESLQKLVEIARNHAANVFPLPGFTIAKDDKSRQDKKVVSGRSVTSSEDYNLIEPAASDLAGFRDQVALLFTEWCHICENATNYTDYSNYISQLQQKGLLKGDDISDRFFHILTELSISHCIVSEMITPATLSLQSPQDVEPLSFVAIDMYANLVVLVVKHSMVDQGSSKIFLLLKILLVTVRFIQKDAEEKKLSFNPRPYFRLFVNWLLDLCSPDPILDVANAQILVAFANAFHALQPSKVPGWSFAWLELVSHRNFMPKLLMNTQKGWPCVQRLLVDLFKFMEPYLRDAELREPVHFLYKGTLRVLLVLLHDFPEFLCDYHFSFCNVIPPSCIQMRNVILSAYPRNMRLPDPSRPNLKIDLLAEISQSPRILSEVDGALKEKHMKTEIDEYFKTRQQGSSFLTDLKQRLLLPWSEAEVAGPQYNVPLINSLVLYVGMQAIQKQNTSARRHATPMDIFSVGPAIDIFQTLIEGLDTKGRYLFLNALVNQLRYPNNHTHYFSFILLYFFAEANQDIIQEQITRILFERLIANRPHPWGLLITFIELVKNPQYKFWSRPFIRCAPEMEKLFESVSISCGASKAAKDTMSSVGFSDNAR